MLFGAAVGGYAFHRGLRITHDDAYISDRQADDLWYGLRYRALSDAAQWVNRNLPRGETLLVLEVGIIGYLTDMRIIDVTGLTTKGPRPVDVLDFRSHAVRYRPTYALVPYRVAAQEWNDLGYRRLAFLPGDYCNFTVMARADAAR